MSWGYRVCKEVADDTISYTIREVFYNEGDRESIWAISAVEATIAEWEFLDDCNEDDVLEGIDASIHYMEEALNKKVIDLDTFKPDAWEEC